MHYLVWRVALYSMRASGPMAAQAKGFALIAVPSFGQYMDGRMMTPDEFRRGFSCPPAGSPKNSFRE